MTGIAILDTLATIAVCGIVLVLAVLVLLVAYRVSLKRHPYTDCRPCQGTGERRSRLFAHSFGYCPDCTGTGYRPRLGARLLNIRLRHSMTRLRNTRPGGDDWATPDAPPFRSGQCGAP